MANVTSGGAVPSVSGGKVLVGIVMGSRSDLATMQFAAETLAAAGGFV